MRVPIIPCPLTKNEKKFKKIGDRFMNHPVIKKNINDADEWIAMKFDQVFNRKLEDFRSVDLNPGMLKTFEGELKNLVKHVQKDKGPSAIARALYTTTAKIRANPEYAKLYYDFLDIQHSFKGRSITNGQGYQKILDNLQLETIARGVYDGQSRSSKKSFNKSVKLASKLWDKQMKAAVDSWNEVGGSDLKLNDVTQEIQGYLNKKEGRVFYDLINIVEKKLPKIADKLEELSTERRRLMDEGKDYSHVSKKYTELDLLAREVPSQPMRNAVTDYLELMDRNFVYLKQGIESYIKSVKAGLNAKGWDRGNIEVIERRLKDRLYPDKKTGYFPHYTADINSEFMNGLMLKFQRLSELTAEQSTAEVKSGQSMKEAMSEALKDTEAYITSRAKHRKNDPNQYSYLFPVVMKRYTDEVSRFNFMSFTQQRTREALNMLKSRFKNGESIDGYASDMINMIQGMHFDMTGQRSIDNPEFNSFLRTALNLEYISKIGGNVRTAGKNLSQWLVNWVEFGSLRMKEAKRYYEQNSKFGEKVDQLLKESGLFYEEAPRELEEGAAFASTKVRLADDLTLEFKKQSFWEKSAEKTSKLAGGKLSYFMRKIENFNRKSAFKVAFYKAYTEMKNSTEYNNERIAAGKSIKEIENEIIGRSRRIAINMTTSLHYDYSHVTKSAVMKHPIGAVVFQFQHFFNEFTRFNMQKLRGAANDWKGGEGFKQKFLGEQAWQAYRLGIAYSVIPGLLSLIFKADFGNVIEHATKDKAMQLWTALTADPDTKEGKSEIDKAFYGKGKSIMGFLGAPLFGDIVTIGELANLYEVDQDGWVDMALGFSDRGELTGDQKAYSLARIANGQAARFLFRTTPMMTSGHFMMGLQSELGLYPNRKIQETRDDIMDGIGDMSPELQDSLDELYRWTQSRRKAALR